MGFERGVSPFEFLKFYKRSETKMGCAQAAVERSPLRPATNDDYVDLYMMLASEDLCVCKNTFAIVFASCIDEFMYTNGRHYGRYRTMSAEQYLRNHLVLPVEGEIANVKLYYNRMLDAKTKLIRHYLM